MCCFEGGFTDICLASRTLSKAQQIASEVKGEIEIAQLDADRVSDTVALIRSFNADLVIHVALPYQDLAIMDACLEGWSGLSGYLQLRTP